MSNDTFQMKSMMASNRWTLLLVITTVLLLGFPAVSSANRPVPKLESIRFDHTQALQLAGRDARLQLLVTGNTVDGGEIDISHDVAFSAEPTGIVTFEGSLVVPLADGEVSVFATTASGQQIKTTVKVIQMGNEAPISFPDKIVPIFTKLGCNGGGCHGKVAGQNGFKLSLLGFGPREDHEHLASESRGRRISLANPDGSLLLLKAINASPHGGGQRLEKDSHEYRIMRRWIAQGMPYGDENPAKLVGIEVVPQQRRMSPNSSQQLTVVATYSDGSLEDITRAAVFESNDPSMASVTDRGLVGLNQVVGDVAVMTRYQGHVSVFRADIPLERSEGEAEPTYSDPSGNIVDELVWKKLKSLGIPTSEICDDNTFLRRVTLDLAGRLPTLEEVSEFQANQDSNKRHALIERLLASEDYADYFAGKWNSILRNQRTGGGLQFASLAFHEWIRESIFQNQPYDQFVRDIVAASGSVASHPPVVWYQQVPDTNQRIEDAAQLFLGQRVQCARCHHHPYEKWSQADYAQLSAFFTTVSKKSLGDPAEPSFFTRIGGATARDPSSGQNLVPAGLDSEDMQIAPYEDPREAFATWMTDPENPFFAKALVNRYWKHFMGRGLVEPEDDLRVTNPPSNPELIDGMAEHFVRYGFDTKSLIRLIVQSKTYQLSSNAKPRNLDDKRSYSRYYPKRLQAEVLLDAIDTLTLSPTRFSGVPASVRAVALPDTGFDSYFLTVFGRPQSSTACECERSQEANLSQSLHLLNSEEIQSKLSSDGGRASLLAQDQREDADKINELYLIAFGRQPDEVEHQASLSYVSSKENKREAFEDLIWSLINSKEFLFNH
ncbi:MAG: DUF1549 domain-containing protein [Rubripirellula sp.]